MKTVLLLVTILLTASFNLHAQVTTTHGKWKLIHARATQTKASVRITIQQPLQGEVVSGPDVTVQFAIQNWQPEKNGRHLHFILDNEPFLQHYSRDPFVFHNVQPGAHVIRVFPVHPWHESVKQEKVLAFVKFYVKEKRGSFDVDSSRPMMVYSTPVGDHDSNERCPDSHIRAS
ncbi:hypothetical protein L0156_29625 [bacterium]|nr:hypothetical protein [bacterium]